MNEYIFLRVIKIVWETADTISLYLENVDATKVHYQAGQFLTFIVDINGKETRRSYSLSSAPEVNQLLAVTIKRVENGEISRYLMDTLKEGDVLTSLQPAGRFTIEAEPKQPRDIFFIAAGSGITPVFSLVKFLLKEEPHSKITLVYSNKNEQTTIFYKEIRELQSLHSNFNCIFLFSDPLGPSFQSTRLNIGLLETLINQHITFDRSLAQFFTCGPFGFMRMVRMTLVYLKFEEEQIHKEKFFTDATPSQPLLLTDSTLKNIRISFGSQAYTFTAPGNKSILRSALKNGIPLPYSCEAGLCSTCAAICKEGKVQMVKNEVLTDKEVAEGWILTCVSYPLTEEVILELK